MSHYPMVSFRGRAEKEGVYYRDNDLENVKQVQRPLLKWEAPTIVVNRHAHTRDDCATGKVLQVSCASLTQPPFDVTILDLEATVNRASVGVERIPVASLPDDVRLSALSPARFRWVFESGAWYRVEPAELREKRKQ